MPADLITAINNLNAQLMGFTEAIIGSYTEFFSIYFPIILGFAFAWSFISGAKMGA